MGVLNVTPDSFSDGGALLSRSGLLEDRLLARASQMVADGAVILDIGGESTRPGAEAVSTQEELDRVIGAIALLSSRVDVILSVDTSNPIVMREAATAGVGMLNDVRALTRTGALEIAVQADLPVSLMHMSAEPERMQTHTDYQDVVSEVMLFLKGRVEQCLAAGMARSQIIIDPGFGFGKTVSQNYEMLRRLREFASFELPLLVGLSRKSMIGAITRRPAANRVVPSAVLAVLAAQSGATIIRVHDVAETADALAVWRATKGEL
ncbi:MAG: dihydropteroate synthase [Halieaceae bacterium]|jgi:dihydropteroate synthase|nr:dihydropteroate synthase [Halieaceae bacterium]MBT5134132.1 dihydropteroate synthase [Halieaceae bacterium]MBT5557161.1 dihydropteroate synthase [Halieaceae bacterium]MBT6181669.1 dihydropteroate synthase [Halieaceae bacterium]MDG1653937.1 dihydropteroate synthase [Luminiphilus sp.]